MANRAPGHKWQPKTLKSCRVPTPPPRRLVGVAEWLLTDVKAHHEHEEGDLAVSNRSPGPGEQAL